jgi:hypothetical protein
VSLWSVAATVALALLGGVSAWVLLVLAPDERKLNRVGVRVPGKVIERLDHGGDGFHGAIEYHVDGVPHRLVSEQSGYDVGDAVVVIYEPGRPAHARVDRANERWHNTINGIGFITLCFGGAIATFVLGWLGVF